MDARLDDGSLDGLSASSTRPDAYRGDTRCLPEALVAFVEDLSFIPLLLISAIFYLPAILKDLAALCQPYRLALLSRRARVGCVVPSCMIPGRAICDVSELTPARTREHRDRLLARVDPARRCAKLEHVLDELLVRRRSCWQISDISFDTSWLWLTACHARTGEQVLIPIDLAYREGPVEQNQVCITFKPRRNPLYDIKYFSVSAQCGRDLYTWEMKRDGFVRGGYRYDLKKPSREWSEQNFGEFFYYRDGAFHLDVSKL